MSGYGSKCLNCGEVCSSYTNHKPIDHSIHSCPHCGMVIQPELSYMGLEELNELRKDIELEPLEKLPKQDKTVF